MTVTVTTDRADYSEGEAIVLTLEIANPSDTAVVLTFASSQRYDFTIADEAGMVVWRWSDGMGFAQMLGSQQYDPGAVQTHSERFEGHLPPGRYSVSGLLTATDPLLATNTFTIHR